MVEIIEVSNAEETFLIGLEYGQRAKAGDIICLSGDLGVGKTVFSKGFAKGLGIDEPVTSPTFTLINEYNGRLKLYHFDVYRISDCDEMHELGFDEIIYGNGVCLIEWAELVEQIIPESAIWITIKKDLSKSFDYRKIEVKKYGVSN